MRTLTFALVPSLFALVAGCSSKTTDGAPFVSNTDETRTLESLSPTEATTYCTDVTTYERGVVSSTDAKKVSCGTFAQLSAFGAKTDADAVAACRKSFDDCMAKPASEPTSTNTCKNAYADLQKCKGTGTTVGDMNACLTESTAQLTALASTDWCAGLKAGAPTSSPRAGLGPKCTAVQAKCPKLYSSSDSSSPPGGG